MNTEKSIKQTIDDTYRKLSDKIGRLTLLDVGCDFDNVGSLVKGNQKLDDIIDYLVKTYKITPNSVKLCLRGPDSVMLQAETMTERNVVISIDVSDILAFHFKNELTLADIGARNPVWLIDFIHNIKDDMELAVIPKPILFKLVMRYIKKLVKFTADDNFYSSILSSPELDYYVSEDGYIHVSYGDGGSIIVAEHCPCGIR